MEAMGLRFVGPQAAAESLNAVPRSSEVPADSLNVPTFRSRQSDPTTAGHQLDFVFASASIADRVRVTARNRPEHWGASDHCRVLIEVDL